MIHSRRDVDNFGKYCTRFAAKAPVVDIMYSGYTTSLFQHLGLFVLSRSPSYRQGPLGSSSKQETVKIIKKPSLSDSVIAYVRCFTGPNIVQVGYAQGTKARFAICNSQPEALCGIGVNLIANQEV